MSKEPNNSAEYLEECIKLGVSPDSVLYIQRCINNGWMPPEIMPKSLLKYIYEIEEDDKPI